MFARAMSNLLEMARALKSFSVGSTSCMRRRRRAGGVIEKHNHEGKMPLIEIWPDSQLEAMLATRPDLIAEHGLRAPTL